MCIPLLQQRVETHEDLACLALIVADGFTFQLIRARAVVKVHGATDRDPYHVMN
jgi:hypothetical protein